MYWETELNSLSDYFYKQQPISKEPRASAPAGSKNFRAGKKHRNKPHLRVSQCRTALPPCRSRQAQHRSEMTESSAKVRLPQEQAGEGTVHPACRPGPAGLPYHVGWPQCSVAPAPCVPARLPSCPVLPAAGAGLPGPQRPQPGAKKRHGSNRTERQRASEGRTPRRESQAGSPSPCVVGA